MERSRPDIASVPPEAYESAIQKWERGAACASLHAAYVWWVEEGSQPCAICKTARRCVACPVHEEGFACNEEWVELRDLFSRPTCGQWREEKRFRALVSRMLEKLRCLMAAEREEAAHE